jgi:MinD superfamily P-loop ATPase
MSLRDEKCLTVSVAAGKGGTGKTLVATSLAVALRRERPEPVELLDCDVEEPNAAILLHPKITEREEVTVLVPAVDLDVCTRCGRCAEVCEFSAIAVIREAVLTFPELCAACGACTLACPVDAISEVPRHVGVMETGLTPDGVHFCQGRVKVGVQRSAVVTKAVKRQIRDDRLTIVDAPPGTACPMQETVEGSDFCLLVTEPTPFGLSDLKVAVDTCRSLEVPCGVVLNREGVGDRGVEEYCDSADGPPLLLRIPLERRIAEAYSRGETLAAAFDEWVEPLCSLMDQIEQRVAAAV